MLVTDSCIAGHFYVTKTCVIFMYFRHNSNVKLHMCQTEQYNLLISIRLGTCENRGLKYGLYSKCIKISNTEQKENLKCLTQT